MGSARRLTLGGALLASFLLTIPTTAQRAQASPAPLRFNSPHAENPILPGYFADPSVLRFGGKWYIYATKDPWGGDDLGVWESTDFANWTFRSINWPAKAAATSPTSGTAKVWAPSVVRARDGRLWMYVSVGNEIWVGTATNPLGPWRDANGGKPLVGRYYRPGFHMIDAEAFIDDDGTAYLYWGSGLNWVNGHCFAVKLKPDMVTFDGEPRDVTPGHYFEGPFMFKAGDRYLLTYSDGKTIADTYQVRYAVGSSPMGPFVEAENNPILATDPGRQIISPGHHAIMRDGGKTYIVYHRHSLPFDPGGPVLRQVAIDRLELDASGLLRKVQPTHEGAWPGMAHRITGLAHAISSSGNADAAHAASAAADDNYATLWRAPAGGRAWLMADLGKVRKVRESLIRPEYPDRSYRFKVDVSDDGKKWRRATADVTARGSPIRLQHVSEARYVRLSADAGTGIFEWALR